MEVAKAIEYNFKGEDKQIVELTLNQGAQVVGIAKDITYIEEGINLGYVKSKDQEVSSFTNDDLVQRKITFGTPYVGKIIPIDLNRGRTELYCLSRAFICAGVGASIEISPVRQNELLSNECTPYVMEKIKGIGTVFLSSNGTVICRRLSKGQVLRVDVSCLLAMTKEIQYDYQVIGSESSGECICQATVLGPGNVWLQSSSFVKT